MPKLVDEYMDGKIKVDEFITHNMGLDKINEGFDLMHAGKRCDYVLRAQTLSITNVCTLTLSLPRVIDAKFLLLPHQTYYVTQYGELCIS